MSNGSEEKLLLTFSLSNCKINNYYQISLTDFEENVFQTERILCENEDRTINFKEKMIYGFHFEKRQKLSITTKTSKKYDLKNNNVDEYERITIFSSLILSKGSIYERAISSDYNSEKISIKIDKVDAKAEEKYLFDFFKLGVKFSCFISFDFSKKEKSSIEIIKENNLSILKNIFQVLQVYTKDHFFHPSGFGGRISLSNLSAFNIDKAHTNTDELIKEYKNFLENPKIIPESKITLSPLLQQTIDDIYSEYKPNVYNILFILISGDVDKDDQKETINNIILSSYLPLSIIIIGVGNHDFSNSKQLFNINNKYSKEGMPKNKNNVIFSILQKKSEASNVVQYSLKELRKQIIEFYSMVKYKGIDKGSINDLIDPKISLLFERISDKSKELDKSIILPPQKIVAKTPETIQKEKEKFKNSGDETPSDSSNKASLSKQKYILGDSSFGPAPIINTPSNSNNISINGGKKEDKKEEEKKDLKEKPFISGASGFNSTKGSDIKKSSFSIFDSNKY